LVGGVRSGHGLLGEVAASVLPLVALLLNPLSISVFDDAEIVGILGSASLVYTLKLPTGTSVDP
jgi:hypothetical protein